MLRRRRLRRAYADPVSPNSEDEEFFHDNENQFWIRNDLFKHIGRSRICVLREHYLDLCSTTRSRESKDIYSTALHSATAKKKHYHAVDHLLQIPDTDINARNRFGETPLLLSMKENVDENIINLLLDYGAACNIGCFRGVTPLHTAALDNKLNLLLKLIEKGADVNAVSNVGVTPLHLAVLASNYDVVCQLLNYNANPKLVTTLEFTPLMLALSFQDVDMRICELLCTHDIHTATRLGNPVYCAIKGQHIFAERLILEGADVNYVGRIMGIKISCLLEAISQNDKHIFDLIWPRFDQETFNKKLNPFLIYFADSCGFRGNDLVECLRLILGSRYGDLLVKIYLNNRRHSFLENFFENPAEYQLTNDNCREIIQALPIVFYNDVSYIYKKFNFNRELVDLLKSYELHGNVNMENTTTSIYIDFLCFNTVHTQSYNLKEILHYLKYRTPDTRFRVRYYRTFSGVGVSTDDKLGRLITLYKLCEEMIVKRSIASLQELSRDKLRDILFLHNKRPYAAISNLPVPEMFKDILLLKMPIYC